MKQCPYCAKEIGYHELYCSDECQKNTNDFHEMREKYQSPFSALNGIFVIGFGVSIFLYSFLPEVAVIVGSLCLMILGALYYMLPFPADVMIERFKLKKALLITKMIAGAIFFIGAAVLVLHFFKIL